MMSESVCVLPVHLICAAQAAARCEMSDAEWERLLSIAACPAPRFLGRDGVALWNQAELDDWHTAGRPYRWHWEAHVHSGVPLGVFITRQREPEPQVEPYTVQSKAQDDA
jgi:hypothetical protein